MTSLDEYVRQMRAFGYRDADIRSRLTASGYAGADIERVVGSRFVPSARVVVFVVLGVLLVAAVGFGLRRVLSGPTAVTLDASVAAREWRAGEPVDVAVRITSSRAQDVRLVVEVVRAESGALQSVKGMSLVGVSDEAVVVSVPLPARVPDGEYVARVSVKGEAGAAQDEAVFRVGVAQPVFPIAPPIEPVAPEVPVGNETAIEPVAPPTAEPPSVPVFPSASSEEPTISLDEISAIAATDVDRAVGLCRGQPNEDRCLKEVAKASRNVGVCDLVQDVLRRDDCFGLFALEGDFTVCPKISTTGLRKACEDLKRFNEENP